MAPIARAGQTYTAFRGQLTEARGLSLGHKGAKVLEMQTMLSAAGSKVRVQTSGAQGPGVHTIEAMGTRQGVTIGRISPGRFEDGGLVRGLRY